MDKATVDELQKPIYIVMPDADGYPLNLNHWGKVHNSQATPELIDKGDYLIADKSYDSHSIRDKVNRPDFIGG